MDNIYFFLRHNNMERMANCGSTNSGEEGPIIGHQQTQIIKSFYENYL